MNRLLMVATIMALPLFSGFALADDIEGTWKRPNGILVSIHKCGAEFCVTAASGAHKGASAGKMAASGPSKYAGTITDLEAGKTYSGKGALSGDSLTMSGCVLGGLFCKGENWARQ
ncbi:MAG: DUF2147 domain-containing protein [Pseudomonadota bacterium]|nr:DUF2147 domain-containing protein [Pseudomonadota bacterium]